MTDLVVVGQVARDLVLRVAGLPEPMGSVDVLDRRELLGGKGANQAVAARQLGASVSLVGVVATDDAGAAVLEQARDDGIDVSGVVRRDGGPTALLVDVVTGDGTRHLLEHVPDDMLLRPDDVRAAGDVLAGAGTVLVQLQQPGPAVLEAVRTAREAGVRVVLDGAAEDPAVRQELLGAASVVRADAAEASILLGRELTDVAEVVGAAQDLLAGGVEVVALAAGGDGNVVAWAGGHVVVPLLLGRGVVDATGAGDAFVVGLATALLEGAGPEDAAWHASAAAALTVGRLGGRPELDAAAVAGLAGRSRRQHG